MLIYHNIFQLGDAIYLKEKEKFRQSLGVHFLVLKIVKKVNNESLCVHRVQ